MMSLIWEIYLFLLSQLRRTLSDVPLYLHVFLFKALSFPCKSEAAPGPALLSISQDICSQCGECSADSVGKEWISSVYVVCGMLQSRAHTNLCSATLTLLQSRAMTQVYSCLSLWSSFPFFGIRSLCFSSFWIHSSPRIRTSNFKDLLLELLKLSLSF